MTTETAPPPAITARNVAAAVLGNALEVYDFGAYAFFAVMIGEAFFPSKSPMTSLLLSLATFGAGFVSRPFGALLIGAYGDRAGRKPALLLTFFLMGLGSAGLALTPSYATLGSLAPVLVVAARLIQGLAFGGTIGPATAFLLEAAPPSRRGLFASWQLASQGLATLAAGAVGVGLSAVLGHAAMADWGWRVPFLLGALILPLAFTLRHALPETLHHAGEAAAPDQPGLGQFVRREPGLVVIGLVIVASCTIPFYVLAYMTTFATTTLHLSTTVSLAATVIFGVATLLFSLLGGALSDRFGRKPLMILPRVAVVLVAWPLFAWLIRAPDALALLAVTAVLSILSQLSSSVALVAVAEALPRHVRSAGMATIYALGVAIFGGSTQFIVAWLIARTGDALMPAWYLMAATAIGIWAMAALRETGPVRAARAAATGQAHAG
ncbi:MAG: MFS transporter [Alphaproteobacteria bacterium]|nr:MFS transporter [Alphaproteobacteria bacterium]MDE2012898.1 MFS transporter [Alphaproteobacteria bacterium]MDE2074846.1 MFS transporter [Alphaproteobacteria bacterium]